LLTTLLVDGVPIAGNNLERKQDFFQQAFKHVYHNFINIKAALIYWKLPEISNK